MIDILKDYVGLEMKSSNKSKKNLLLLKLIRKLKESGDGKYRTHKAMLRRYGEIKKDMLKCLPLDADMLKKTRDNRVGEVIAKIRKALFPVEEAAPRAQKRMSTPPEDCKDKDEKDNEGHDDDNKELVNALHVAGEEHGVCPHMSADRIREIKLERTNAVCRALEHFEPNGWMKFVVDDQCSDVITLNVSILLPVA